FDDTWLLTDGPPAWVRLSPPGLQPLPRFRATAAYSPEANGLIVALGASNSLGASGPQDLWTLADATGRLPVASLDQATPTYVAAGLDPSAVYLWRVVVRDQAGAWRGSSVWRFTGNKAPVVDAGPDAQASLPDGKLGLSGSASDDGLP